MPWIHVISDLNGEKIMEMFYEKELQKTNQETFRIEKVITRKGDKLYVKWKGYDNFLIAGLMKKTLYKMSQYFPKPYNRFGGNVKVELALSNYATKTDLKGATGIDMSNLALKSNLAKLKAEVDKVDVDKLKTVPTDLN